MANKYSELFEGLSSRQIYHLYFQLLDTVENDSDDHKLLLEACEEADAAAIHREFEEAKMIENRSRTETMDCIFCGR